METPIRIENRGGKVRLKDVVTKGLIDPLMDQICTLYGSEEIRNDAGGEALDTLEIEIDSEGGSVAEGYRLYKTIIALRERGVDVIANISDKAYSMGGVIAMAATKVRMAENSRLMIHEASATIKGDADRMRHVTGELEQISQEIAGIYAARTGHPVDVIRGAMKRETWLGAEACVRLGFADETYPVEPKAYNPSILERLIGNKAVKKEVDLNATKLHYGGTGTETASTATTTMSILSNLKPDAALVAKLEAAESEMLETNAQLVAIESELSTTKTELIEATSEIAGLRDQLTEASAEVEKTKAEFEAKEEAFNARVAEFTSELETAVNAAKEAEAKATPEAIQSLVTDELAKASHTPIENANTETVAENKITREAFNALTPRQRMEFVRKGGSLKE